jgi:hypothetical protein
MLSERAQARGIIRRRAGSALRVSCRRDHRGILLRVWIRGMLFSHLLVGCGWENVEGFDGEWRQGERNAWNAVWKRRIRANYLPLQNSGLR